MSLPRKTVKKVMVRDFKSLKNCEIELGRVNVLVGPNGAGKSNLLEAIGVLGAAVAGRVDDEALLRRGVRPGVPALYKSSFKRRTLPKQISLEAELGDAVARVLLSNPNNEASSAWTFFSESLDEGSSLHIGRSEANKERMDPESGRIAAGAVDIDPSMDAFKLVGALRDYAIYSPGTQTLRGMIPEPGRFPVGLGGGRLAEAFSEILKQTSRDDRGDYFRFIPWVKRIHVGKPGENLSRSVQAPQKILEFTDRFMAEGRNTLSAYDASEGALYVLFSMVAALHPGMPPLFAIDNIDHGIHPVLCRALFEQVSEWILEGQNRQLICTVQNPAVLDGLPLGNSDVRLFVVSRLGTGETSVRRIEITPELLHLAEQGWTLSRMWVSGELGGVPDV